jgi:hypothetical protein
MISCADLFGLLKYPEARLKRVHHGLISSLKNSYLLIYFVFLHILTLLSVKNQHLL